MNSFTLTMALIMGFTGSLHCAGMCGPIVWILPFQHLQGCKKAMAVLLYHFGRISSYVALGLLLHSFRDMFHPRWQQHVSVILGILLLGMGILSFFPNRILTLYAPWTGKVKLLLGKLIGRPGLGTFLLTGILNGLLPCGLVYMALAASMSAGTSWETAALLYAFGAGTAPMLMAITLFKRRLPHWQQLRKAVPVLMLAFGSLFVLRGMNLGIPYLSPKIQADQTHITATCCHK